MRTGLASIRSVKFQMQLSLQFKSKYQLKSNKKNYINIFLSYDSKALVVIERLKFENKTGMNSIQESTQSLITAVFLNRSQIKSNKQINRL